MVMILVRTIFIILILASSSFSAKYAGEPFSLGVGGRTPAIGGAGVTGPFDASAGYWNPAGLNYLDKHNILAMHAETFGSLLNHDFVSFTSKLNDSSGGLIDAYGFYLYYLGGGGINITELNPQTGRPYISNVQSHGDFYLAGSLARHVKNNMDLGVTVRLIYRDLITITGYGASLDAGALYQPSQNLRFGLMVTDLTVGFIHYSDGHTESVLPTIKPGVLFEKQFNNFAANLVISADIKFEGQKKASQFSAGAISLDSHFGLETSYRGVLFGRAGFDRGDFTAGIGICISRMTFDFNYLLNSGLDDTFRASAGFQF